MSLVPAELASLWLALLVVAPLLACDDSGPQLVQPFTERAIQSETLIGPRWSEIQANPPLEVVESMQRVHVALDGVTDFDPEAGTITLADGSLVKIEAELVDDRGETYGLTPSGQGRGGFYLSRTSKLFPLDQPGSPGPDFPPERTYPSLRVRADPELRVDGVSWICTTNY